MATQSDSLSKIWAQADEKFVGIIDWKNLGELPKGWKLPTHLDLPESDGRPVENFAENPQGVIITESLVPLLKVRHPDKQYCIGQNSGIYWRRSIQPLDGVIVPDWFYVSGVPPMLDGDYRRSYVMWQERKAPFMVMEFVSGSGEIERDDTPAKGKFWIYENVVQANYYVIFDSRTESLELYRRGKSKYKRVPENADGRCPIPELKIELGIWEGEYANMNIPWLRMWDLEGDMRLHFEEMTLLERQLKNQAKKVAKGERRRAKEQKQRAEHEKQRAEHEKQRAEQEKQRADKLAEQLRKLGVNPDDL